MQSLIRLSDLMSSLRIEKLELGPIGTNAYLIWECDGGDAVLIDAPPDCSETIKPILEKKSLFFKRNMAYTWPLGSHGRGRRFSR